MSKRGQAAVKADERQEAPAAHKPEALFSKPQLLAAKRFTPQQRDVLAAVLTEGQAYSFGQAERLIEQFGKRTVE